MAQSDNDISINIQWYSLYLIILCTINSEQWSDSQSYLNYNKIYEYNNLFD